MWRTVVRPVVVRRDHLGGGARPECADDPWPGDPGLVDCEWQDCEWDDREWDDRERLETILDSISEAVVCLDRRLAVTRLNASAVALTGYNAEQAARLPLEKVLPLRSEAASRPLRDLCRQVALTNQPVSVALTDVLAAPGRPEVPVDYRVAPVRTARGQLSGVLITLRDVTDVRALLARTREAAQRDPLTGLWNRSYLWEQARRPDPGFPTGLLFVDLDNFKEINDVCGHAAGDCALVEVALVLAATVRTTDEVIRMGGDEFVVLLRGCGVHDAAEVARAVGSALTVRDFAWGERCFRLGASIGVACDPAGGAEIERLIREADGACYSAKRAGGGTVALAQVASRSARGPRRR
jgi:diguanylate cyclase (GGDEF)-like protein/PAS domain S-box-containing protein